VPSYKSVDTVVFLYYYSSMKRKTSITVSPKLLKLIDALPDRPTRSKVIEDALILYFKDAKSRERDRSDINILNELSKAYNAEALDTLEFQTEE
jgi:metal-responsive CopG/Arc/MetJ family transcriptional regulator